MSRVLTVAASATATATAAVITGCDRLAGDHITPYPVGDANGQPSEHLTPVRQYLLGGQR